MIYEVAIYCDFFHEMVEIIVSKNLYDWYSIKKKYVLDWAILKGAGKIVWLKMLSFDRFLHDYQFIPTVPSTL